MSELLKHFALKNNNLPSRVVFEGLIAAIRSLFLGGACSLIDLSIGLFP
jgi:hypothetical protein